MDLFVSPHNDDETLFGAYTIMRNKPLVLIVTDGKRHQDRYGIPVEQRRKESIEAMAELGAGVVFLGIPDDALTLETLLARFKHMHPEKVWAPAWYPNGNPDHNVVALAVKTLWYPQTIFYSTYTVDDITPRGDAEILPENDEAKRKEAALAKYISQLKVNAPHFDAVQGKPEYYVIQ